MEEKLFSIEEVAKKLNLHHKTIRRYITNGGLKANRVGKQWRISQEDLNLFLDNSVSDVEIIEHKEVIPIFSDIDIKKLAMKVALFVGENDIMLHSKDTANRLSNLLPEAEINFLEGKGHSIVHFGEEIRLFLES